MPCFRVLLVGKRLFEIGTVREKVSAQNVGNSFASGSAEQLRISFIRESISDWLRDRSRIKIVVGQLKPPFLLRKEQSSILEQSFVEAAHIHLFHSRRGWLKRKAAERANLWRQAQEMP